MFFILYLDIFSIFIPSNYHIKIIIVELKINIL